MVHPVRRGLSFVPMALLFGALAALAVPRPGTDDSTTRPNDDETEDDNPSQTTP